MIKKYLKYIFTLFIIGFSIINFSSALKVLRYDVTDIGGYRNNNTVIDNNFNFYNSSLAFSGFTPNVDVVAYRRENDGLHFSSKRGNGSNAMNGTINGYFICTKELDFQGGTLNQDQVLISYYTTEGGNGYDQCSFHTGFDNFGDYMGVYNKWSSYSPITNSYNNMIVCMLNDGFSSGTPYSGEYICVDQSYVTVKSNNTVDSNYIQTNATENPFLGGGGGGGEEEGGDDYEFHYLSEDAIRYFENMGFRKSMCYVGTNDLTTNYGSGSDSFQSGTGKTIFDLFESIYIDIDETDLGLQAVSNWLNSRLGNYDKRFSTDGNPGYRLFYSSVDELIHVYYYGDGDTPVFQFLNNPYAIYFMASNISTYTQYKSMFDYEGDEVVDYCNLKLNGGTFEDMISTPIKDSIVNNQSNNIGGNNFLSGSWGGSGSFIGGGTGGTGVIEYTGTWSDLQFSGDVDLKSFFDNALDEMKNAIGNMQNPLTGVLPNYLIFALLLVVLFKILRH